MASNKLLELAKKVIREAGKIGLEAAGQSICGPAWPYAKRMLAPVVEELEKKFPKLFLVPEEAQKAADALSSDDALQKLLQDGFAKLESGQEEILAALARQENTLIDIGARIDQGFKKAGKRVESAQDKILEELRKLNLRLDYQGVRKALGVNTFPSDDYAELSISEIFTQANTYQQDSIKWLEARDPRTATLRLAEGRNLVHAGLVREPENSDLLVSLGFIEKSQAQVSWMEGKHDVAVLALTEAEKYFAEAWKYDPQNVSAMNGIANIHYFARDYDRAIKIGRLLFKNAPHYGAAIWDLSLALEHKFEQIAPDPSLLEELQEVYQHLETLMPNEPQYFLASHLSYVQKRRKELSNPSTALSAPLMHSLANNDIDRVKRLIDAGADVNSSDKFGASALHWVTYHGYVDLAELLLAKGADVNAEDVQGNTPIDIAYRYDNSNHNTIWLMLRRARNAANR